MTARKNESPGKAGDLLIIHPGALGDVVAMFGLMAELKSRFGRLTLVCRPSVGYLAEKFNLIDRRISHETGYWSSLYTDRPDDRVIQLLNGHRQIILFSVNRQLENTIHSCCSAPCLRLRPRPPAHTKDHVTRFAARSLVDNGLLDAIPEPDRVACRHSNAAAMRPAGSGDAPTLLHPGAGSPRKRWPIDSFLEVASRITSTGGRPEILLGPAERDLFAPSSRTGLAVHVLHDIEALLQLLVSAAAFIGNDSGVAHLAACLGLPTTVIFTASDPRRWRPNGPAVAALSPDLPCQPCFEIQKENCPEPECRTAVTPDAVWQTHYRQIAKRKTDAPS